MGTISEDSTGHLPAASGRGTVSPEAWTVVTWEEVRHLLYITGAVATLLTVLVVYVYVRYCRLPVAAQALSVFVPLSPALTVAMLNYVWDGGWTVPHGTLLLFSPATVCLVGGALVLAPGLRRGSPGCRWAGAAGLVMGALLGLFLLRLIGIRDVWGTALRNL